MSSTPFRARGPRPARAAQAQRDRHGEQRVGRQGRSEPAGQRTATQRHRSEGETGQRLASLLEHRLGRFNRWRRHRKCRRRNRRRSSVVLFKCVSACRAGARQHDGRPRRNRPGGPTGARGPGGRSRSRRNWMRQPTRTCQQAPSSRQRTAPRGQRQRGAPGRVPEEFEDVRNRGDGLPAQQAVPDVR
jgi:hypothetical protein